jgi:LuxR family maltose regulon positive regulatory protein
MEDAVTALLNEIAALPDSLVLVLDDYHAIESKQVHAALRFLLDYAPPQMHLVLATRSEPPLPLSRLRARRQMNELREADFRFTQEEATTFLNQVMGLGLSPDDVRALGARTEGWIAGLQLAALALQETLSEQGRSGVRGFIQAFAGTHRYILDYLADEVLLRQPEHVQSFLMETSILDRLTGGLCDAVTGRQDGRATLDMLESANLFLIHLDDEHYWYRYHSLFSDLLRLRLEGSMPDRVPELHRRASEWYVRNGRVYEALGHALEAQDFERAARLVEEAGPTMAMRGEAATLLQWLDALPDHVRRSRPRLALGYAWVLFVTSNMDAIEPRLQDAVRALGEGEPDGLPAAGTEAARGRVDEYLAEVDVLRAFVALYSGDAHRAVELCHQAARHLPEGSPIARSGIGSVLGDAYRATDQTTAAKACYQDGLESSQEAGNVLLAMVMTNDLARLNVSLGKLHEAERLFQQVLAWGGGRQVPLYPVGQAYIGLGDLQREWDDLATAEATLSEGILHCERGGYTRYLILGLISLARLKAACGDREAVVELLDRAEKLARGTGVLRFIGLVAAYRAQLSLVEPAHDHAAAERALAAAVQWARTGALGADDTLEYSREVEYLALARVLIAQGREGQDLEGRRAAGSLGLVRRLLARLLQAAEKAGRWGSAVEILTLQALACRAQGEVAKAILALERALALARPEGYVRLFADEGAPMADLLQEARRRNLAPEHCALLMAAFARTSAGRPAAPALPEPLTERELEVLRLLAACLSSREIAAELVVSLSTAKAHVAHILRKLDVHNRTQAAALARDLHLL